MSEEDKPWRKLAKATPEEVPDLQQRHTYMHACTHGACCTTAPLLSHPVSCNDIVVFRLTYMIHLFCLQLQQQQQLEEQPLTAEQQQLVEWLRRTGLVAGAALLTSIWHWNARGRHEYQVGATSFPFVRQAAAAAAACFQYAQQGAQLPAAIPLTSGSSSSSHEAWRVVAASNRLHCVHAATFQPSILAGYAVQEGQCRRPCCSSPVSGADCIQSIACGWKHMLFCCPPCRYLCRRVPPRCPLTWSKAGSVACVSSRAYVSWGATP
jgi:hypothetical protein